MSAELLELTITKRKSLRRHLIDPNISSGKIPFDLVWLSFFFKHMPLFIDFDIM